MTKIMGFERNTDPELLQMLENLKGYVMTPEEKKAQRMSWVIGEMMLQDENLTREEAIARYKKATGE